MIIALAIMMTGFSTPACAVMPQLAAGSNHTVALRNDGTVWTWGDNSFGQLGNGDTSSSSTPVQVTALSGMTFTAVAAGSHHTVALRNDGTVWAWGNNDCGQLGNSDTSSSSTPIQVAALSGMTITTVAAGSRHTVALRKDGTVWSWGYNGTG